MATSGRGTGIVGYNVQTAVDVRHHLIIEHEVTNLGHDRTQLEGMAKRTRDTLEQTSLTVLADRGYFSGEQILACEQAGITALVPKPLTSGSKADGRFDKRDFIYDAKRDEYRCPAGERAVWRFSTVEKGLTIHKYWPSACPTCPLKAKCTPAPYRRVARWEHEQVIDAMQVRLERMPQASRLRRQTVEHPFATLKAWMGSSHFLDEDAAQGANRDESSRPGLQHEANDDDLRRPTAAAGDARVARLRSSATTECLCTTAEPISTARRCVYTRPRSIPVAASCPESVRPISEYPSTCRPVSALSHPCSGLTQQR